MAVVLVTGCSSGFGLLTALAFARRGDRVFATMRNLDKAGPLRDAAAAEGLVVDVVALDVASDDSVRDGVAAVLAAAGRIDVLVNNAGSGARAAVETFPDAVVRSVFETNVFGALRMLRAVLPGMRAQRSGVVVTVSSIAGLIPVPYNALYSATKHALEAFSEALSFEVEPFGVRVAIVEPGYFRTAIADNVVAASPQDPASPYADAERHAVDAVQALVAAGGDPQVVADVIVEAATTDTPRLRWPVGEDADRLLAARASLSEAEWAETLRATLLAPGGS